MNYVQYGKSTKNKKGKKSTQSGASGGSYRGDRGHETSSKPGGKGKKLPFLQDTCYRCGKGWHQKTQDCKALEVVCRGCGKKGHFEKVCLKAKHSMHSLEVPQASTSSTGASEPLYFDDQGQLVFAHMVSVLHLNKHLIKFPIALDYKEWKIRSRNKMENSTDSTGCSKLSTILLKADTGADVNLMNKQTFNQLFGQFYNWLLSGWKIMEIQQWKCWESSMHFYVGRTGFTSKFFYVTDCDRSPNLLSQGCLLHTWSSQALLYCGRAAWN